jgi:hypothetical protein
VSEETWAERLVRLVDEQAKTEGEAVELWDRLFCEGLMTPRDAAEVLALCFTHAGQVLPPECRDAVIALLHLEKLHMASGSGSDGDGA